MFIIKIFLPELSLVIEYNGEYHYQSIPMYLHQLEHVVHAKRYDTRARVQERDTLREFICKTDGFTLVVVPCWWDNSIESLANCIQRERPDVQLGLRLHRISEDHFVRGGLVVNSSHSLAQISALAFSDTAGWCVHSV